MTILLAGYISSLTMYLTSIEDMNALILGGLLPSRARRNYFRSGDTGWCIPGQYVKICCLSLFTLAKMEFRA